MSTKIRSAWGPWQLLSTALEPSGKLHPAEDHGNPWKSKHHMASHAVATVATWATCCLHNVLKFKQYTSMAGNNTPTSEDGSPGSRVWLNQQKFWSCFGVDCWILSSPGRKIRLTSAEAMHSARMRICHRTGWRWLEMGDWARSLDFSIFQLSETSYHSESDEFASINTM